MKVKTCCCNCWLGPVVRWEISVSLDLPIIQFYHLFFEHFSQISACF
nr:MAG TPA: coiled-coil domain-containing protein [Caudoviricetes sp.]